ncbi:MAG: hypothetical protein UHK60_00340 [Acutalibacteraceae bacterium]|nr:hypothetical protein [Acutalibacteraceae bacterium]
MNELAYSKITADVITDLAKSAAKNIVNKIAKIYKDTVNKDDIDLGTAFEKYLKNSEKHVSMAKTILYGQTPRHLYSFFECMGITDNKKVIDTSDVNNILDLGHKIIISGTGGIGKSMLMRHCFLNSISNTQLIPVLIELRGLNEWSVENISIEKFVYNTLNIFGFDVEQKYFEYSLETGCYLILFDGYDEVKNSISAKVTQEIIDFSNKYPENYIILSSRPLEEFTGWSDFSEYSSMHLNKEQALSLISKLDYDKDLKDKFYKELDEELFEKYKSFASNPLLLTIMLMTFEGRISIPDSKTDFYEQAFSALFHRHDARKQGYKREILSGLSYEDFKKVFSYFCFRSFFKNQYEFTEKTALENISRAKEKTYSFGNFNDIDFLNDMVKAVCVLVHEGLNYRWSHRSFQEYFAALYSTQLSDDEQKKFITSWLKSTSGRLTTDYLDILRDLQPDRFVKNVLYEPLKELYNLYKTNDCSKDFVLQHLYLGMGIRKDVNKEYDFYIMIRDSYLHTISTSMLKYFHYPFYGNDPSDIDEHNKIADNLVEKYGLDNTIKFDKLKKDGLYDDAKKCLSWAFKRFDYLFKQFEEFDVNSFGRKRTFESMLEQL